MNQVEATIDMKNVHSAIKQYVCCSLRMLNVWLHNDCTYHRQSVPYVPCEHGRHSTTHHRKNNHHQWTSPPQIWMPVQPSAQLNFRVPRSRRRGLARLHAIRSKIHPHSWPRFSFIRGRSPKFFHIYGTENPSDILSKHWGYSQVWNILQPILFYEGDTMDLKKPA